MPPVQEAIYSIVWHLAQMYEIVFKNILGAALVLDPAGTSVADEEAVSCE